MSYFQKKLKEVIGNQPYTRWAKERGLDPASLNDWLNKGRIPRSFDKLTKATGISKEEWLGIKSDPTEAYEQGFFQATFGGKLHTGDVNSDSIYIESYPDVRAAAGTGQISPTDQTVVQLKVNSADWRRYVGLDHKNVKVITVYGDSMHPTLSHGDQVMVDTACSSFIDDAIYCIQQGENLRFKRIKLNLDGSIVVKSDNEKEGFPPEIYSADEASHFRVIGRVIPLKFGWFEI